MRVTKLIYLKLFCISAMFSIVFCEISRLLLYLEPETLQTKTNHTVQEATALKIIQKYYANVTVHVNHCLFTKYGKDSFSLHSNRSHLRIEASSGVAAVWGFHYFLKRYCRSYVGWQTRRVAVPRPLPAVARRVVAAARVRYYQSPVTASYSFVWWNTSQWVRHVEWMALNGINVALAPVDQERVWRNVYRALGMGEREVERHFTGPAFLAWLRLGVLSGWRGGLPRSWHHRAAAVRRAVVPLMYRLGIAPVLPAFNGHVPHTFRYLFPNASFYNVSRWNKFPKEYSRGLFLNGNDPLFPYVAKKFLTAVTDIAGKSGLYSADPFYEATVCAMTEDNIKSAGSAILAAMEAVDERAVWMLQSVVPLGRGRSAWRAQAVQALLRAAPRGRLLALAAWAERRPLRAPRLLHGHPFVWCLTHNYGGQLDMIGNLHLVGSAPILVRDQYRGTGRMVGIGITPEGINQNYVVYDLVLEMGWRKTFLNVSSWVRRYADRRYGCSSLQVAWELLLNSVYGYTDMDHEYYLYYQFTYNTTPSLKYPKVAWYPSTTLFQALKAFVNAPPECYSEGFYHDLVAVGRQALQYRAGQVLTHRLRGAPTRARVPAPAPAAVRQYLAALGDMKALLATHTHYSLAGWLGAARRLAASPRERRLYELNALTQLTLWGPRGELSDYAAKQWAEMYHYYYIPRWKLFFRALEICEQKNITCDEDVVQKDIREYFEKQFFVTEITPLRKQETLPLAIHLYYKWKNLNLPDLPRNFQ